MADAGDARRSFDASAGGYDELLLHNRTGAQRLVASLPPGDYRRILDVGCGTGFVTEAMVARFGTVRVAGVDPSEAMLDRFRDKLDAIGVEADLHAAGVHDMPVPDGVYDAVVSGMAFHWFPDKPAAVAAMARRLRPGGVLAILASGRGTDEELRRVLEAVEPPVPPGWIGVFDLIQRDAEELASYMHDAGLAVIDAWEERRIRRTPPEAYMARIAAVASHLSADLDPAEAEAHAARVTDAVVDAAGPDGFRYAFVKIYGVARRLV